MSAQIEQIVSKCSVCQSNRNENCREPLTSHDIPNQVWSKVGTDLFEYKKRHYVVCVDYFSKFPELEKIEDQTSKCVVDALKRIFSCQGIPNVVMSDNGPCYQSSVFREFANSWGFQHITSSPGHSQSNGQAENYVKTLKSLLKNAELGKTDFRLAILEYRTMPIDGLNKSPSEVLYGRQLRTLLPSTKSFLKAKGSDDVFERLLDRQHSQKYYVDQNKHSLKPLNDSDSVRFKLNEKWVPGVVDHKHSDM